MSQKQAIQLQTLTLIIVCINPPNPTTDEYPLVFGLQTKAGELSAGEMDADGAAVFRAGVQVKGERFLYLSTRDANKPGEWLRRLKIRLGDIPPALIEAALAEGKVLTAMVDGRQAARAKLVRKWAFAN